MSRLWNRAVLAGVSGLCRLLKPLNPPRPLPDDQPIWSHIVVVQNTALGDYLMSTPAIRALRISFPKARLTVIGHRRHADLMAMNPDIDRLLIYRGKAKSYGPLVKTLTAERIDLGLVLHGNDPETIPLLWRGGARYIVAPDYTRLTFLLSRAVPYIQPGEHMINHRLRIVEAIGATARGRFMEQAVDQAVIDQGAEFIDREAPGQGPVICLAPGASHAYKRWPGDRFAELAGRLARERGARIIALTSAAEAPLAERILSGLDGPRTATNGRLGLAQIAGLLKNCTALIANDSGPFHLGLALGRPTLGLFGAYPPEIYGPLEAPWGRAIYLADQACSEPTCLKKQCPRPRCLEAISVEEVAAELAELAF